MSSIWNKRHTCTIERVEKELNPPEYRQKAKEMKGKEEKLQKLLDKLSRSKELFNIALGVRSGDSSFEWSGAAGHTDEQQSSKMRTDSPYFIASITKIYTATAFMMLHEQGVLPLETPVSTFFSTEELKDLHTFKGKDYTAELKLYHLLGQTSGLADYFEQKGNQGESFLELILKQDQTWDLEKVFHRVKTQLKPKFPPAKQEGSKQKAFYSDTNYQLLGRILEQHHEKKLSSLFQELFFGPLGLSDTYIFGDDVLSVEREAPALFYNKKKPLHIPKAMASFGPDGAIVSTVNEQLSFLQALFKGELIKQETLERMRYWNKLFFPLEYGYGLMRYKLPWIFSPFSPIPEFIGHSGASGSFSFYCPKQDLYVAGTINQLQAQSLPFRILPQIAGIMKG